MNYRPAILFVLALGALVALFMVFQPGEKAAPAPAARPQPRPAVDLVIERGRLVSGPSVIRATQGDAISIRIRCDVAEEFHLHGYDRMAKLEPAKTATLEFVAEHSGRFEFELEKSGRELGALEVAPR